jgi:hypothetical protein
MVPTEYSKDFINEIPSCKLHMIEDRGHISHIEKPIEFTKKLFKISYCYHHMIFSNRKKKKKSSRDIVGCSDQVSDKLLMMLDSTI